MDMSAVNDGIARFWEYLRHPPRERTSRLERHLRWSWQRKLTAMGRSLLWILLVVGTFSMTFGPPNPIHYFAIFLFSFLLMSRLMNFLFWMRVKVERSLPERCACGVTLSVRARVKNVGRLPVFDLTASEYLPPSEIKLEDQPQYLDYLGPGEEAEVTYTLECPRRGVYDFSGPVAMTAFPFGVYNDSRKFSSPQRLLVYPRFVPLQEVDLPVGRRYQPGGLQMVSRVGDSEEFLGNREYRPGDRLRDIDHAAWARVGKPVVREYQQEYLCRIALIVDTCVPKYQPRQRPAMEAGLSLAAAVADVLSRQEYVIDIFAIGTELYHFQAGRSLAYLDNILDVLACIEECQTSPFQTLTSAIQEATAQISTAVFVLLDWDEEREQFVRAIRDCGVAVKVAVVRQGEPTLDPSGFRGEAGPVQVFTPAQIEAGVERL